MTFLVGHLFGALVLAGVLSAFLGWWWHLYRSRRETQLAEAERARLRAELVRRARAAQRPAAGDPDGADELAFLRQASERQAARVADLERRLEEAGAERDRLRLELQQARQAAPSPDFAFESATELNNRIAELELELDDVRAQLERAKADRTPTRMAQLEEELQAMRAQAADAGALRVELIAAQAQLRTLAQEAPDPQEAQLKAWRLAYFESRCAELEALLEAARSRAAISAPPPPPPALPAAGDDELNVLRWRNRYLAARTAYLEGRHAEYREQQEAVLAAAAAQPDEEAARRAAWRSAYLDRRLGWVIERSRETVAAADEELLGLQRQVQSVRAALEISTGDLEAAREARARAETEIEGLTRALEEAKASALAPEAARRLRWRTRYLEQRVRQLEEDALARMATTKAEPVALVEPGPVVETAPPSLAEREPELEPAPGGEEAAPNPPLTVPPPPAEPVTASPPATQPPLAARPPRLGAPRNGAPDDLRLIQGVTPQIESKLNASGIYHFDQIADWTSEQAAWVDTYLALKGQIEAEGWVAQARRLAAGELPPPRRFSVEAERL